MTPQTCLKLAETVFGHTPQAIVVSARGHQFGFSRALSKQTARLAEEAIEQITSWLNKLLAN
jgi:hypothetical protein